MASNASLAPRGLPPKPPDKGSFPLDHFRECSGVKTKYMECLKAHNMVTDVEECRQLSAAYLECRMESKLMAKEDLSKLGYHRQPSSGRPAQGASKEPGRAETQAQQQRRQGFVAGVPGRS
jgi:cytochrome c oxidase assembly protein subunit 19